MEPFVMSIAGTAAEIRAAFESTEAYFAAYRTEDPPLLSLEAAAEDRVREQQLLDEEALQEGLRRRVFTEPFLERAALARKYAAFLAGQRVLLLHGSTVAAYGKGYLFTAKTGTGKSTHTRLWREMLGRDAVMVNDDRTFLDLRPDRILACGSPWSGKHGLDTNILVPLQGICLLERGTENRIVPLSSEEALPLLLEQAFVPAPELADPVQALVRELSARVPLWKLECTKEPEAARIALDKMADAALAPLGELPSLRG